MNEQSYESPWSTATSRYSVGARPLHPSVAVFLKRFGLPTSTWGLPMFKAGLPEVDQDDEHLFIASIVGGDFFVVLDEEHPEILCDLEPVGILFVNSDIWKFDQCLYLYEQFSTTWLQYDSMQRRDGAVDFDRDDAESKRHARETFEAIKKLDPSVEGARSFWRFFLEGFGE